MTPQPFTFLNVDSEGRDVIAFHQGYKMLVARGEGLLNWLRNSEQFVEAEKLPGERPKAAGLGA